MRAEPERNEKDKIIESDLCETIIGIVKDKDGKEQKTECGRRTSWKCDKCEKWVCHLHFSTLPNRKHKEICQACEEEWLKKGAKK
jgi:hypothetical protein